MSENHRVRGILPPRLNLAQRIHALFAKEKERTLWQLVTEERVDEINSLSRARPTDMHKNGRKEGGEHPQAVDDQEGLETVTANPLKE